MTLYYQPRGDPVKSTYGSCYNVRLNGQGRFPVPEKLVETAVERTRAISPDTKQEISDADMLNAMKWHFLRIPDPDENGFYLLPDVDYMRTPRDPVDEVAEGQVLDPEGRLKLPGAVIKELGLTDRIKIAGVSEVMEVFHPDEYDRLLEQKLELIGDSDFNDLDIQI